MLLDEFENEEAIIDPSIIIKPIPNFPEVVVSIFSHYLFDEIVSTFNLTNVIGHTKDVDGIWPIYELIYKGKRIGFSKARLGGPACAGTGEEIISMGAKTLILLGNCGVLDRTIEDCGIIIPTSAIRDEGTSYHYLPASDEIEVNQKYLKLFEEILEEHHYSYVTGKTWTTDAFYRETKSKMERRKKAGAITVEMECASMAAMCQYRHVDFFQFLYAGDNLDNDTWDVRSLNGHVRLNDKQKIALLAFELASRI